MPFGPLDMGKITFVLFVASGLAQTINPLVGTWQRVADSPAPPAVLFFGADGYYAQIAIPTGRSKPKNDFDHMTREELMKQFGGVRASYGIYKVSGTKLTRKLTASVNPGSEGTEMVQQFRIQGDDLVLKTVDEKAESRFRRMR